MGGADTQHPTASTEGMSYNSDATRTKLLNHFAAAGRENPPSRRGIQNGQA